MSGNTQFSRAKHRKKRRRIRKQFLVFVLILVLAATGITVLLVNLFNGDSDNGELRGPDSIVSGPGQSSSGQSPGNGEGLGDPADPDNTGTPDEIPVPTPTVIIPIPNPYAVEGTRPVEDFGLQTAMQLNGSNIESYSRSNPINFGDSNHYTDVEGILTFRGNNFRDTAAYGSLGSSVRGNLEIAWQTTLPEIFTQVSGDGSGAWFGMGWTGQPLIAKWSPETRANMNLNDTKKGKADLKEVIFGTMGASIYFLDLDDGKPTRSTVAERWIFKGAGALDPRGYPLFYVGAGDVSTAGPGQNLIYSLTDTKELFNYGERDSFRQRLWQAFDGSTIVHGPTDSITYPSETNVIYQFTLNSQYDLQAGTMSIAPSDMFKWKYSTTKLREAYGTGGGIPSNFYPQFGFESSPVFWREYMYIASNCGNVFCINVNTFEVVWICDTYDDTDASPVLELDHSTGNAYIYIGNSAYFSRSPSTNIAQNAFFKINAVTGEKVWETEKIPCLLMSTSGGIKSTAALGKNELKDLVFVTFANVANSRGTSMGSYLIAYDKETGQEVWRENFGGQCWSSPVDVYDDNGKGYIVYGSGTYTDRDGNRRGGFVHLVDGRTGERVSTVEVNGHIEASPVVYDNMIVIGTRGQVMYGIRIT